MAEEMRYSRVVLLTGAGASVPCGLPDMKGFAREFVHKLVEERVPKPELEIVSSILYGTDSPGGDDTLAADLEGLLLALTSIASYPQGENPSVGILKRGLEELGQNLADLTKASAALTDLIPSPITSFTLGGNPRFAIPGIAGVQDYHNQAGVVTIVGSGISNVGGFPSDAVKNQAGKVTKAVSEARQALNSWRGQAGQLPERASEMLQRVKGIISGRYSSCDVALARSFFDPLYKCLVSRCDQVLDVFTMNYDPSIEMYCMSSNGIELVNGFEAKGGERVWSNNFEVVQKPSIRLYKLHGSVTWYTYQNKIIDLQVGFGSPTISTLQGVEAKNMLIYPITAKPIWLDPYQSLFAHLFEALREAKLCVVIGFSYRDDAVISALSQACTRNPSLKIIHCGMSRAQASKSENLVGILDRMEFMKKQYGEEGFNPELGKKVATAFS